MRKTAWQMTITVAVVGALSMFLRWLQMQNVLKDVGGGNLLVARASGYSTAVLLAMLVFTALSVFFTLRMRKGLTVPEKPAPPRFHNIAQPALAGVSCVLLLVGAILLLAVGDAAQKFIGLLFLLSAAALVPLTLVRGKLGGKYFTAFCAAFVAVVLSVWLILAYKENAEDPQLWLFVPGILAIASSALGFYYLAGYPFGRAKPARALLVTQLATYLNLLAVAYPGAPAQTATARTLIFVALALLFLVESWAVVEER